jgi:hypothetical protein
MTIMYQKNVYDHCWFSNAPIHPNQSIYRSSIPRRTDPIPTAAPLSDNAEAAPVKTDTTGLGAEAAVPAGTATVTTGLEATTTACVVTTPAAGCVTVMVGAPAHAVQTEATATKAGGGAVGLTHCVVPVQVAVFETVSY